MGEVDRPLFLLSDTAAAAPLVDVVVVVVVATVAPFPFF